MIENFFHLPPVSTTAVVYLELRVSLQIFEKIRNGPNGILRGLGETESWKNQKSKISWHCPFKASRAPRLRKTPRTWNVPKHGEWKGAMAPILGASNLSKLHLFSWISQNFHDCWPFYQSNIFLLLFLSFSYFAALSLFSRKKATAAQHCWVINIFLYKL